MEYSTTAMKKPFAPISRRHFLATTAAALALPAIVPSSVFCQNAPSKRINLGVIGWGMQGPGNTKSFLALEDCHVVAACDLDTKHLASAVNTINDHYENKDCQAYHDYRELLARADIDAVMIAVPDNWHEVIATEAARRKKDIYGEKPLAKTIAEQQAIVRAVQQNKIIWQTGSWQRSQAVFRKAAEIVRNGLIGKVTHVEVGLPSGHHDFNGSAPALLEKLKALNVTDFSKITPGSEAWKIAVTDAPAELDYQTWIGPARMEPYIKQRVHMNWRWNYNTGGGQLLDWIGHHCDIAHWGLGFDNEGPLEIEGHGEFPAPDALWNSCTRYRIKAKYPQDITFTIAGGHQDIHSGTKWIGTDGWVWVDRGGFEGSNPEWKKTKNLAEAFRKVKLYESANHQRNFIDCVKSRQPTITPVETAHHSAIPGHLGLIAMQTGRKLRWDNATETILGDAEASKLLKREYRAPWKMS
jgi:predicted dehydrogenase